MGLKASIDSTQMAAYAVTDDGNYWVGYDTPETHRQKMCYARSRQISNVFMWDAELDDNLEMLRSVWNNTADACVGYKVPRC